MLNIVVVRPMPRVRARTAMLDSATLLRRVRKPYRRSRSIGKPGREGADLYAAGRNRVSAGKDPEARAFVSSLQVQRLQIRPHPVDSAPFGASPLGCTVGTRGTEAGFTSRLVEAAFGLTAAD